MKLGMYFLLAVGLAVVSLGCAKDAAKPKAPEKSSAVTSANSEETAPVTGEFTLVSLKVPNMTWGGCEASVRGDLAKVEGIAEIETSIPDRTCSFKVTKPDLDYMATLTKLAETNSHIAGFEVL